MLSDMSQQQWPLALALSKQALTLLKTVVQKIQDIRKLHQNLRAIRDSVPGELARLDGVIDDTWRALLRVAYDVRVEELTPRFDALDDRILNLRQEIKKHPCDVTLIMRSVQVVRNDINWLQSQIKVQHEHKSVKRSQPPVLNRMLINPIRDRRSSAKM